MRTSGPRYLVFLVLRALYAIAVRSRIFLSRGGTERERLPSSFSDWWVCVYWMSHSSNKKCPIVNYRWVIRNLVLFVLQIFNPRPPSHISLSLTLQTQVHQFPADAEISIHLLHTIPHSKSKWEKLKQSPQPINLHSLGLIAPRPLLCPHQEKKWLVCLFELTDILINIIYRKRASKVAISSLFSHRLNWVHRLLAMLQQFYIQASQVLNLFPTFLTQAKSKYLFKT